MSRAAAPIRALGAVLLAFSLGGCPGEPATPAQCREILDRIVELELRERGFQDPILVRRRQAQYRDQFADELKRCEGKSLGAEALDCVRQARGIKDLVHSCLR